MIMVGMVEENLRRFIVYYDSFLDCVTTPSVGTLFFLIAVVVPVITFISAMREKKKAAKAEESK